MIIMRDRMTSSATAAAARGFPNAASFKPPPSISPASSAGPAPSTANNYVNFMAAQKGGTTTPLGQAYAHIPLQQREAMREAWAKEKKLLLKKASNSQGDSVERLLANYLAV